jgi:hypothetical protein
VDLGHRERTGGGFATAHVITSTIRMDILRSSRPPALGQQAVEVLRGPALTG